jgi:hypothetical protein
MKNTQLKYCLLEILEKSSFSSKNLMFERLYIKSLIYNNCEILFIPYPFQIDKKYNRVKLIAYLWHERHVLTEGESLYMIFMFKLCRKLCWNKQNNGSKIVIFSQIMSQFLES